MNETFNLLSQISKHILQVSIQNKSVMVQLMALHRKECKPLPQPIMAMFTDAYMRPKMLKDRQSQIG